jgi:hypothetical protein
MPQPVRLHALKPRVDRVTIVNVIGSPNAICSVNVTSSGRVIGIGSGRCSFKGMDIVNGIGSIGVLGSLDDIGNVAVDLIECLDLCL